MVKLGTGKQGNNLIVGDFVRVSDYRAFNERRGRIGLCVRVKGKETWFNAYGNESGLSRLVEPIKEDSTVEVTYNERAYTDRSGNRRTAKDIVTLRVREQELQETVNGRVAHTRKKVDGKKRVSAENIREVCEELVNLSETIENNLKVLLNEK